LKTRDVALARVRRDAFFVHLTLERGEARV
jgi:hypothetical protein